MGHPVVFRPWTRRRERPRSSRDHNLNPIDVLRRFSTSAGPSDIQHPPIISSGSPASPGIIRWGRDPHFEGHCSTSGILLKWKSPKYIGPNRNLLKPILRGTPMGRVHHRQTREMVEIFLAADKSLSFTVTPKSLTAQPI